MRFSSKNREKTRTRDLSFFKARFSKNSKKRDFRGNQLRLRPLELSSSNMALFELLFIILFLKLSPLKVNTTFRPPIRRAKIEPNLALLRPTLLRVTYLQQGMQNCTCNFAKMGLNFAKFEPRYRKVPKNGPFLPIFGQNRQKGLPTSIFQAQKKGVILGTQTANPVTTQLL